MSVARGGLNGRNNIRNIASPFEIDCNFIVDSTNGNGLGIRSLKSNGYVRNVFMNTSATPGSNDNMTNPNPVAGYALVQMKQNFNKYIGGFSGVISPLTSTSTTSLTSHHVYVITSLGTTTLAQWQTAGLPAGFTPTVGQAFVSTTGGSLGGTGTVGLPSGSTIVSVSVVGDPNQMIANSNIAADGGAILLVQFLAATSSSTTTPIATAPSDGSVVALRFNFDSSSVTIDGL